MESLKALVVETSTVYQSLLQQVLQSAGFNAVCVKSGQEALDLLDFDEFDLICAAMNLTDMSGAQLCQHIRSLNEAGLTVPIAVITAEENKSHLQAAMHAGATQIFNKKDFAPFQRFLENWLFNRKLSQEMLGRVLYVEDSRSQAQHLIKILETNGHRVTHFRSAEAALAALQNESFDLVLTDIILDGAMSGLDLVREIRSQPHLEALPILSLSAAEDSARRLEILRSGANDYINKPVIDEELLLRVQNTLKLKKMVDRLEEQQSNLQNLAMKDQLTGLYNRHFFMEVGPKRISEAYRHNQALSMLVLDVDHFKSINDKHGHSTGDAILSGLADVFQHNCRNEDVAVRFGGEEFVLLLNHCDLNNAAAKGEFIRNKIATLCPSNLNVTISIGVSAIRNEPRDDLSSLFKRADRAVYQAKEAGRNRVVCLSD